MVTLPPSQGCARNSYQSCTSTPQKWRCPKSHVETNRSKPFKLRQIWEVGAQFLSSNPRTTQRQALAAPPFRAFQQLHYEFPRQSRCQTPQRRAGHEARAGARRQGSGHGFHIRTVLKIFNVADTSSQVASFSLAMRRLCLVTWGLKAKRHFRSLHITLPVVP